MEPNRAEEHQAGRRAREVYRYFRPERLETIQEKKVTPAEPDSSPKTPGSCNSIPAEHFSPPGSPDFSQQSFEPTWAPLQPMPESLVLGDANETLNSFAQLAAFRLNVDRVFISVSDRDSQFIIAQAARNKEGNNANDSIGHAVNTGCYTLDVSAWNMCKDTLSLHQSNRARGEYNFLVSNDLSQDERYKDLPFVAGEPGFRFYAGTPLTTESHVNIGCFFALDTKPHLEFSYVEKETMGHMGMLIMDFLKVSRQASDGRHAARLSRGINLFVEGHSSFTKTSSRPASVDFSSQSGYPGISTSGLQSPSTSSQNSRDGLSSRSRSRSVRSTSSATDSVDERAIPSSFDTQVAERLANKSGVTRRLPAKLWTFRRAANLIRESLELEEKSGVVFLETGGDFAQDNGTDSDTSNLGPAENCKPASVLALSTPEMAFGPDHSLRKPLPVMNLDEQFLRGMLRRHKRGQIWNFHRDGLLTSSESEDYFGQSDCRGRRRSSTDQAKSRRRTKAKENSMLNRYFPGAAQVLFVPLWNVGNSQWFGGFFCWTNVEHKVFSPSIELSSLLSFGSSIMAECSRIETVISDQQKDDFLGSISHELRSPLHGVLAATEMLKDTNLDQYQNSLLETVDACGRTLLDTMNQVLDFSKLMSLERKSRRRKRRKGLSQDFDSSHLSAAHLDLYKPADLSVLAEEVVEGVFIGHIYNQRSTASLDLLATSLVAPDFSEDLHTVKSAVKVIIDIARTEWIYHAPPGAIRRIIMNLFSNALKYTSAGQVCLRLETDEKPETSSKRSAHQERNKERNIILTVSDTGKGISEDFLRERLFTPFAQEDSLAVGSGLGLSIVRSLIQSLGGSIEIKSCIGEGTTVRVTIPLTPLDRVSDGLVSDLVPPPVPSHDPTSRQDFLLPGHEGRTVAILGVDPSQALSDPNWADLARYITDWYGLRLVSMSRSEPIDLIVADALPSEPAISQSSATMRTALLVVSDQYVGCETMQVQWLGGTKSVNVIHHPCGPHKLRRHISKCLDEVAALPRIPETNAVILPERPALYSRKSFPVPNRDVSTRKHVNAGPHTSRARSFSIPNKLSPKPSTGLATGERDARILVVEDNKVNLNLMLAYLKKRSLATLDSAENGCLAVEAVKNQDDGSYDIIFMDISMPEMDGFEAARAIRALEKERSPGSKRAIIVALTGLSSLEDESKALESGMDMFLTKPVSFKSVEQLLKAWTDNHA
ncbi:Histidine kinase 4 [Penicillium rolfsii]|nr:Histidine kinase 4 [Penicillium rolfsii]